MPREDRRVSNIKQDSINEIDYYPSSQSVAEGDIVIAHPKGKPLRLYKKLKGMLWWIDFTNDKYKDLDVRGKLDIGRTRREPNQPAFLYFNGGNDANITVDGWTTVDFDTKAFDVGGNFASDTFTAPVKGLYFLTTQVTLRTMDVGADGYRIQLLTSNRSYTAYLDTDQILNADAAGWHAVHPITSVCDMDAGDTASVLAYQDGGAQETDVIGHSSAVLTWFSGYLLG